MHRFTSLLILPLAVALLSMSSASVVHGQVFTTAAHNLPSSVTIEIWLGNPDENPEESLLLATLGPIGVNGSVNVSQSLDVNYDGTLSLNGSALTLDNFGPTTLDLDPLGTIDVSLSAVNLNADLQGMAVIGTAFSIDSASSGSLSLNNGLLILDNPTGGLAFLLPGGSTLDLSTDPQEVELAGLLGLGIGGTTDNDGGLLDPKAEVNLYIPGVMIEVLEALIWARLSGEIHVAYVPEPSTYALLGMGLVGLLPVIRRRLRK